MDKLVLEALESDNECSEFKIKEGSPRLCVQRIFELYTPPNGKLEAVLKFEGDRGFVPSESIHVSSYEDYMSKYDDRKFYGNGTGIESVSFEEFFCFGAKIDVIIDWWTERVYVYSDRDKRFIRDVFIKDLQGKFLMK